MTMSLSLPSSFRWQSQGALQCRAVQHSIAMCVSATHQVDKSSFKPIFPHDGSRSEVVLSHLLQEGKLKKMNEVVLLCPNVSCQQSKEPFSTPLRERTSIHWDGITLQWWDDLHQDRRFIGSVLLVEFASSSAITVFLWLRIYPPRYVVDRFISKARVISINRSSFANSAVSITLQIPGWSVNISMEHVYETCLGIVWYPCHSISNSSVENHSEDHLRTWVSEK